MIRIIFEDGSMIDCENVAKIFIEEKDHDEKVTIVGHIPGPKLKMGDNENE